MIPLRLTIPLPGFLDAFTTKVADGLLASPVASIASSSIGIIKALIDLSITFAEIFIFFIKDPIYFVIMGISFVVLFSLPTAKNKDDSILDFIRRFASNTKSFVDFNIDFAEAVSHIVLKFIEVMRGLIPFV